MLYGDAENEPKEADMNKLVEEIFHTNLLLELINMKRFEFEARKDIAQVYNFVLRQKKAQAVEYVKAHPQILRLLVDGYNDPEIALNGGSILREVIRHEELNELLLNDPHMFDAFFEYVQLSTFDVASDAFATFKLMLTKHKVQASKFLESHFDDFCTKYNVLLQSRNYVTKRQSLKLLGELLLNRSNFTIMMKYINSSENLKIMMNLLRGNCFPLDHQVLTSAGFVTLSQAKASAAAGKLEVACWIDGRLEYHAATVVEKPDKERVFVSIGGQKSMSHIDLCVTDNHRVFGRVGTGISTTDEWNRRGKEAVVPPLAVHEAGGLLEHVKKEPTTMLQLMAYAEHGVVASGELLPFVAPLGLTTEDQTDAFLLLYGYWLGNGWLNAGKICFGPRKMKDMVWLEDILERLPLKQRASAVIGEPGFWRADNLTGGEQRNYAITEPGWVQFFWSEYGPWSSSSASVAPRSATSAVSASQEEGKWFWYWVYRRLGVRRLRLVLAGLRMADGDETANLNRTYTSSARFRDEIVRVAMHAGYSASFTLEDRIGAPTGVNEQGMPIVARRNTYVVNFTTDPKSAVPKEKVQNWVTSATSSGVVWCVTVPEHTGQLIIVRRVHETHGEEVINASRPVIVGNTKAIQFEAFHVFKIFVANPKKSPGIVEILSRNKKKLIEFLMKFQKDKENADEQFNEEKNTLLKTLNQLEDLSEPTAPAAAAAAPSSSSSAAESASSPAAAAH